MSPLELILWALGAGVAIVILGFAAAIAVALVKAGLKAVSK